MSVFRIDVQKTVQAICLLLKAKGRDRLEYISILKLLYIADRESLQERGATITGDFPVAMKNGPVLSEVYALINREREEGLRFWLDFLHREDYDLEMKGDPGDDLLSPYEERKLVHVAERFGDLTWRQLVDLTHEFEEWKANDPTKQGRNVSEIPIDDILRAVGQWDNAAAIKSDMTAKAAMVGILQRR